MRYTTHNILFSLNHKIYSLLFASFIFTSTLTSFSIALKSGGEGSRTN